MYAESNVKQEEKSKMLTQTLTKLFIRDLTTLQKEIQAYSNENDLWKVTEGISNSAGNLCLHLVGNLNHFIGAELGQTGYVRQRDLEFTTKDVPRETLLKKVEDTKTMITESLKSLTKEQLQEGYRRNPFEDDMTTEYFLVHLTMHLGYHLGQINYHRRILN